VLGERAVDLDHRLTESAPEDRREAEIVDRRVLEEVGVPTCLISFGR
jgi:hypothetical protein